MVQVYNGSAHYRTFLNSLDSFLRKRGEELSSQTSSFLRSWEGFIGVKMLRKL
jgi:hypothetical protein